MDKVYLIIDNASNKLVAKESDYGNACELACALDEISWDENGHGRNLSIILESSFDISKLDN